MVYLHTIRTFTSKLCAHSVWLFNDDVTSAGSWKEIPKLWRAISWWNDSFSAMNTFNIPIIIFAGSDTHGWNFLKTVIQVFSLVINIHLGISPEHIPVLTCYCAMDYFIHSMCTYVRVCTIPIPICALVRYALCMYTNQILFVTKLVIVFK